MTEMQASEVSERIQEALAAVERGETVIIKRGEQAIARVVPEDAVGVRAGPSAFEQIETLRNAGRGIVATTLGESLQWRHEGHKY